jgi:urease alpha subunit
MLTDEQTGRQTDSSTRRKTEGWKCKQAGRLTDRQTNKHADRRTERRKMTTTVRTTVVGTTTIMTKTIPVAVDPQSYKVHLVRKDKDGSEQNEHLTCPPADRLSLAQRYFLF